MDYSAQYAARLLVSSKRDIWAGARIDRHFHYIVDGQVSIYLEGESGRVLPDGERVRLCGLGRGRKCTSVTTVGELGLYLNIPRTASVIADLQTLAYRLTCQALEEIQQNDPGLAAAFHQKIARQVSERLVQTNRGILALLG